MKIQQEMRGAVTVGQVATFLGHAIANGVSLDAPIEMRRGRQSDITEMVIDLPLPGFENGTAAAAALKGKPAAPRQQRRPTPPSPEDRPSTGAPALGAE